MSFIFLVRRYWSLLPFSPAGGYKHCTSFFSKSQVFQNNYNDVMQ